MKVPSWYTHDGNTQNGPYTEGEVQTLVVQGKLFPKTYVWKTGMSDWATWEKISQEDARLAIAAPAAKLSTKKQYKISRPLAGFVLIFGIILLAPKMWSRVQFELKLLEQVRDEDRALVRDTIRAETLAITLPKQEENLLSLLIVNRLPFDSWVRVKVDGIPETLLNKLSSHSETIFQIKSAFELVSELRQSDGSLIPAGEYTVAVEVEGNPPALRRTLFLGGKRDSVYLSKLKEFHSRVQTKAGLEIQETELYLQTLENQLQVILKKPSPETLNRWQAFQTQVKTAVSASLKTPQREQLYHAEIRASLLPLAQSIQELKEQSPAAPQVLLAYETKSRIAFTELRRQIEAAKSQFPLKESKL